MSQRSLRKQMKGSDYKSKWSQQTDDVERMSNHEKRKDKFELVIHSTHTLVTCGVYTIM